MFDNPQPVISTQPIGNEQARTQESVVTTSPTQSHEADNYDFTLPGLDLFQTSPTYNADEEDFKRRMKRKKKRGQRPKF